MTTRLPTIFGWMDYRDIKNTPSNPNWTQAIFGKTRVTLDNLGSDPEPKFYEKKYKNINYFEKLYLFSHLLNIFKILNI